MKSSRLKSITLVNSGGYSFSTIEIDGNVLLSGANGSGKSTFLRVVLFFYNSSTLKRANFGIDKNKESFLNFYFPYPNSYILYEYINQYGKNFVLLFRTKKLRFKFFAIDNNQNMDLESIFLLNEDTLESDSVISNLRKHSVSYSDGIFVGSEYFQKIIYGQEREIKSKSKKSDRIENNLEKFALYRATSEYRHIGNTLKNIFLNHKINADSIKSLLVSNIDEIDRPSIQLKIVKDNIDKFLDKQESIEQFSKNIKIAESIAKNRNRYVELKAKEEIYLLNIMAREDYILKEQKIINGELKKILTTLKVEKGKEEELEKSFSIEYDKLKSKRDFLKRDIKEAKGYLEAYYKNSIKDKLEKYNQIDTLNRKRESIIREKEILIGKAEYRVKKFDSEISKQKNRRKEIKNSVDFEINQNNALFLEKKEELRVAQDREIEQINPKFQLTKDEINLKKQKLLKVLEKEKDNLTEIKYKNFYQNELQTLNDSLELKNRQNAKYTSQIELLSEKIKSLQTQIENKENNRDNRIKIELSKANNRIQEVQKKIDSLDSKINSKPNSFIAFLNRKNVPFKNQIFSILKDETLTSTELNPKIIDKSKTLYGIEIDIPFIESLDKLKEELKRLKEQKETQIEERDSLISLIEDESKKSIEKIERERGKLYQSQSELNKKIPLLESEIKRIKFEIEDKKENAKEDREKELTILKNKINDIIEKINGYQKELDNINKKEKISKDEIEKKYNKLKESEEKKIEQKNSELNNKKERDLNSINETIKNIKTRRDEVLDSEGINQDVLDKLETSIKNLGKKIKKYKDYKEEINEYLYQQKPKIDKLDIWKEELNKLKDIISIKEREHDEKISLFNKNIENISKQIKELEERLKKYQSEIDELKQYKELNRDFKQKIENLKDKKRSLDDFSITIHEYFIHLTTLTSDINSSKEEMIKNIGDLFKKIDHPELLNLQSNSDNSIEEFLRVGADIERFLNEKKIEDLIIETVSLFKRSIRRLYRDIEDIKEHTHNIDKQLNKIKKGINNLDNISVIDKIDINLQDSENQILLELNRLKEVHDKYDMDYDDNLGKRLFEIPNSSRTQKERKADREMMEIFKLLSDHIANHKQDYLSLDECFEIVFKVIENGNESRWQNSLNGIGSEGTDIIIKILIYISLLSITKKENIKDEADIHCLVDEIGKLSPLYFKEIIDFSNALGIYFVNGMPSEMLVSSFKNHYKLRKIGTNKKKTTIATRIIYRTD